MAMMAGARAGSRLLQLRSSALLSPAKPCNSTASRTFAADHGHGPARVNMWEDPSSPSKWKEEHFVFASLAGWGLLFYGWGLLFYGGYKAATRPKKQPPHPKPAEKAKPVVKNAERESASKKRKSTHKEERQAAVERLEADHCEETCG